MRLTELLGVEPEVIDARARDTEIAGLTSDSRSVEPGFLFAALPGVGTDGRLYIGEALKRGAACVLGPPGTALPQPPPDGVAPDVPLLISDSPRRLFAQMAARFFAQQPATIAAVTGTNGKTSAVNFARQLWTRLGRRAASMGTLGIHAPALETPGSLTTPDPVELHRRLRELAEGGVDCLALEASSHGLAQHRLDGVEIGVGAFTNLTRDHLDYHGSMEAYEAAKSRLFSELLKPGAAAVLNADDPATERLERIAAVRRLEVVSYGWAGREVRLEELTPVAEGQLLSVAVGGRSHMVSLPLPGAFQAMNALCALAVVIAAGEDASAAVAALSRLEGVRGRLERVARLASGATIYVDYAHTPDALANVLDALRPHAKGRLVVVFGCGGDRDAGKRPVMGRIAAQLADAVVVTDDNPRREDAADIRRQILDACAGAREIADRAEAIGAAISELRAGDVLVIAGKGHETGQIVGDAVRPFDDAEVARAAVREGAS